MVPAASFALVKTWPEEKIPYIEGLCEKHAHLPGGLKMITIDPTIVGFEFPSLDFIICLHCALSRCPDVLKEAVEDATGTLHPDDYLQIATDQFALHRDDAAVDLLNCHLIDCQQPLLPLL
jgi:hypothetical protein